MIRPLEDLQAFLTSELEGREAIRILEAGCGSASHFRFEQRVHMTGIDISEKQLTRNDVLDDKLLGDIETYDFEPSSFDVIICWDVLEHLARPELALENFAGAAKPGGLVVLGRPNVMSLKGMLTKNLPYRAHVWVYKYIFRHADAGKDDVGPFKTFLKLSISPNGLKDFAKRKRMQVAYFNTYDAGDYLLRPQKPSIKINAVRAVYGFSKVVGGVLSFGKLGDSEIIAVLRK